MEQICSTMMIGRHVNIIQVCDRWYVSEWKYREHTLWMSNISPPPWNVFPVFNQVVKDLFVISGYRVNPYQKCIIKLAINKFTPPITPTWGISSNPEMSMSNLDPKKLTISSQAWGISCSKKFITAIEYSNFWVHGLFHYSFVKQKAMWRHKHLPRVTAAQVQIVSVNKRRPFRFFLINHDLKKLNCIQYTDNESPSLQHFFLSSDSFSLYEYGSPKIAPLL